MHMVLLLAALAGGADDAKTVYELDVAYQAAVKRGDAAAMERIFHPQFRLINGKGVESGRAEWLKAAREGDVRYEIQDAIDNSRSVRVDGDTAVVTAKLWIKGALKAGGHIDKVLWYSDTYVRTQDGWKYFAGQASLALPDKDVATSGPDVDAVSAMNSNYIRAWREHDMGWFRTHLAEVYTCIAPDGRVLDKTAFVSYPDHSAQIQDARVEQLTVRVYAGSTAIVTGNNLVDWKDGRKTATSYTDTYAKIDGQWKAVAAQLTSAVRN